MHTLRSWVLAAVGVAVLIQPGAALATGTTTVKPTLERFCKNTDGSYSATFGYVNSGASVVTIPIGSRNKFTPDPADRGQPTTFEPGTHTAVTVRFGGGKLTWRLSGKSATANATKPVAPCEGADLAVTKSSVFGLISPPGGLERYTITVTNNGPNDASDVIVTDALPAGTTFVPSESSAGCVAGEPGTVICTPAGGTLAVGQTASFRVIVQTPVTPGTLTNTATAGADPADPVPSNDTAIATTDVLAANGDIAAGVILAGNTLPMGATDATVDGGGQTVALRLVRDESCGGTCAEAVVVDVGTGDEETNTDPTRPIVLSWAVPIADLPPGTELDSVVVLVDLDTSDGLQGEPLPVCRGDDDDDDDDDEGDDDDTGSGVADPSPCENSRREESAAGLFVFEILMLSNDPGFIIR